MRRNHILTTALFLLLSLVASGPAHAAAPYNQWNGTGPLPPVAGDQRIGALLVRNDGILFGGNGSGTVFSYEYKAPDAATGGANGILGTSAILNATVNANNAATTVTFQYGTTTGYGSSVAADQSPLSGSTPAAVTANITGLAAGTTYHYRVAATSSAGTVYGADQAFTAGQAMAVVTLGNLAFTYDGTQKSTTATTSPAGLTVVITYNGSTTPPTTGGSYTVIATVNDANYQGSATATLTIAKANATVTLTPASLSATYDATPKAASATTTPPGLTVGFTYTGTSGTVYGPSTSAPTGAGSYAVVATINDASYQGTANATLVIAKASQAITFNPFLDKTYGAADFGPGASAASGLVVTYTSDTPTVATVTPGGLIHIMGQGTAVITATQVGDANYAAAPAVPQTLTVNKALLTVTADNASRAVGAANPAFTATITGFVNGEGMSVVTGAPAFSTTADSGSAVGSYPITPYLGTLAAANYSFAFADGTLAVGLASQTVTFGPLAAKSYGDAPFTVSATGGASGNPVTFSSSDPTVATVNGATVTIVGAGTATITASQAGNNDYASAQAQQTLTVNKALLTVTADNQSRAFGIANPALAVTYSGFVNNENASVLTGTPAVTTTAVINSPVGSYPITPSVGTLGAANYSFIFVNGTLAVGLASQTIAFSPLAAKSYGDASFDLSASGGGSGNPITFSSSDPTVATINGATVTITGAGTVTITASQAGSGGYAPATAQQPLTVTKALLTVSAQNASRAYGTANPAFTPAYSGFVSGDTAAVLQGAPALATAADATSPPGTYPITAGIGNLASNTYQFTFGAATLTVTKATAGITLGNLVFTYDGTPKAATAATSPAGLGVTITYNGSTTVPTASGSYAVAATVTDPNYQGSATATLVIAVAGQSNQTITFGPAPALAVGGTATVSATASSGLSVTFTSATPGVCTVSGATVTVVTAGTCTIAADQAGNSTYNAAPQITQTITIAKAGQSIGAIGFTPSFLTVGGSAAVSATATSGLAVAFTSATPGVCTVNGATVTGLATGTCTIVASQAGNANFSPAAQVTQSFTVAGQSNQTITFGPAPALAVGGTATVSATASSGLAVTLASATPGVCTVSGAKVTGISAGTCTIIASQAGNATYGATSASQSLTVTSAAAPALAVSALPDGAITSDTTQNISGTATDRGGIPAVTVNGAVVQVSTDGSFSYAVQLVAGANTITVVATNNAGSSVSDTRTITLDHSAPKLTVTYPPDNSATIQQSITVTGSLPAFATSKTTAKEAAAATDPTLSVTWSVDGSTPQAASITGTAWSFTAPLGTGMNTIQVSASNGAGQRADIKRTVTWQPAFSLAVTDPDSDIRTPLGSYTLTGSVTGNTTSVNVTITMDGRNYTPTVTNGAFRQQLTLSDTKVYQVGVTAVDQNNNSLTVQRNIIHTLSDATAFTISDALLALQIAVGIVTPDPAQLQRLDVAPLVNGVSVSDGTVDIEDAIVILRMAVGLIQ